MPGVAIEVVKRLPLGGGLGGGSSDAATTLVALNELWGFGLPVEEIAALGLKLGADVPVFVHGHAAWAEGVGERLTPLDFPESVFVVLRPDASVSTAEVFKAPELTRDSPVLKIAGFLTSGGRNDFEPVVRSRYHGGCGRARLARASCARATHWHRVVRICGHAGRGERKIRDRTSAGEVAGVGNARSESIAVARPIAA